MTEVKKFDQGYGTTFSTRPVGLTTYLLVQPYFEDEMSPDTSCTWHIELCGEPDHMQPVTSKDETIRIDISAARGALVSVRNTGGWPFRAWTDY